MSEHAVVSRDEWLAAQRRLLAKEKELTRLRDALGRERRALPWVHVDQRYVFDGPSGAETLADLFAGRSQLLVYHFMFAPEWERGCPRCSFWADNFNGIVPHLGARDTSFVAISRAPLAKLQAFARRLGWTFKWVSSGGNTFNADYHVSFSAAEVAERRSIYNYGTMPAFRSDLPGISAFYKDAAGDVFHTYSVYGRGIEMMNTAYHYLDVTAKGRDEGALPNPMDWVRLHDEYA